MFSVQRIRCTKEMQLKINFVEKMRTTCDNKEVPQQTLFTTSLIRENRFILFDSVPLPTLRFEISQQQKRMTFQNFLQYIEHRVAYSARNFAKSSFNDVKKLQNARLPMVRSQMD